MQSFMQSIFMFTALILQAIFPVSWFLHSIVSSYTELPQNTAGLIILFVVVSGAVELIVRYIIQMTGDKRIYLYFEIAYNWLCFWGFSTVIEHHNSTVSTSIFLVCLTFAYALQRRVFFLSSIILILIILIYTSLNKSLFQTIDSQKNDKDHILMYCDVAFFVVLANSILWRRSVILSAIEITQDKPTPNIKHSTEIFNKNNLFYIASVVVIHVVILLFGLSNVLWLATTENYFAFYEGWWIVWLLVTILLSMQNYEGQTSWQFTSSTTAVLCIFSRILYFAVNKSQTWVFFCNVLLIFFFYLYSYLGNPKP